MAQIPNLDERIEIAKGGASKYGVSVADGTEVEKVRSNAMRGQDDGTVPSAKTAEQIAADRSRSRQYRDTKGAATEIHMPDTAEDATDGNSVKIGALTFWLSDNGGFWTGFDSQSVNPNLKCFVMGADGKKLEVTGAGAIPLYTELKRLADASKAKAKR